MISVLMRARPRNLRRKPLDERQEKSPERASHKLYGVRGIPAQFVIGRDGKVAAFVSGYMAGEVLLEGALAKAGIKVDPAIVAKAAEDQKKRDER